MSEVSTKNLIIWDTNSINMWILADEACRFTNFSNIMSQLRHNDFILKKMILDLRSEYQDLFVC